MSSQLQNTSDVNWVDEMTIEQCCKPYKTFQIEYVEREENSEPFVPFNFGNVITENTNQSEISGTSEITPLLENARGFQWRKLTIRRIIFALLTLVLLEMKFSFLWQYLSPEHDIFPVTKLTQGTLVIGAIFASLGKYKYGCYKWISYGLIFNLISTLIHNVLSYANEFEKAHKHTFFSSWSKFYQSTFGIVLLGSGITLDMCTYYMVYITLWIFISQQISQKEKISRQIICFIAICFGRAAYGLSGVICNFVKTIKTTIYSQTLLALLIIVVFLCGKSHFIIQPPYIGTISANFKMLKEIIKTRQRRLPSSRCHWLDRAKFLYGGSFSTWEVEDLKRLFILLPVVAVMAGQFIFYSWIEFLTIHQSNHLKRNFNLNFYLVESIALLTAVTILAVAYWWFKPCDILKLFCLGSLSLLIATIYGGVFEMYLVKEVEHFVSNNSTSSLGNYTSSFSLLYQTPCQVFYWLCNVIIHFSAFSLIIEEAPPCFHGLLLILFYVVGGICFYLLQIYIVIIDSYVHVLKIDMEICSNGEIKYKRNLQTYFLIPTPAFIFVHLLIYVYVTKRYKEKREEQRQLALAEAEGDGEDASSSSIDWDATSWNDHDPTLRISTAY
ncbi:solute carrier family 15 member 4-like isoform X2 [Xenia sp. Carnegie-2017]|uniref:solute carrier family 15 member 4-like isoform X2 n=1 Tax=Xenia sp. Carnegie-2017 TaxID=2897299 RepID=UPI001F04923B|nr:solute carrier family 15 member 4-like isoform X2 [Xenia sp. Carnegie-2017]